MVFEEEKKTWKENMASKESLFHLQVCPLNSADQQMASVQIWDAFTVLQTPPAGWEGHGKGLA